MTVPIRTKRFGGHGQWVVGLWLICRLDPMGLMDRMARRGLKGF